MKPIGKLSKLIIFVLTFLALTASAYAQSPREELTQMVEQLQKTPADNALREKIIKLGMEIKPAPAITPEARRAFVMGTTYQKEAKSPDDFALAVKTFQEAVAAAPWWADAYYNLSVALESARRYDEAKNALTLYLLTQPKDAEQAQERLYAIDAKKVLVAKQQAEATRAAIAAEERKRNSIEGYWFFAGNEYSPAETTPMFQIERVGEALVVKPVDGNGSFSEVQITETSVSMTYHPPVIRNSPRFDLELRSGDLVGTVTTHVTGSYRLTRKPWPTK